MTAAAIEDIITKLIDADNRSLNIREAMKPVQDNFHEIIKCSKFYETPKRIIEKVLLYYQLANGYIGTSDVSLIIRNLRKKFGSEANDFLKIITVKDSLQNICDLLYDEIDEIMTEGEIAIDYQSQINEMEKKINDLIIIRNNLDYSDFLINFKKIMQGKKIPNRVIEKSIEQELMTADGIRALAPFLDFKEMNRDGLTIFLFACFNSNKDVVKALIECGANINDRSPLGTTPLMFAASNDSGIVEMLIKDFGVPINDQNFEGWTALHCSIKNRKTKITEKLLKFGANAEIRNNDGKKPREI